MSESSPSAGVGTRARPRLLTSARRWLGPLLMVPTPVIFVAAAAIATWLLWRQGSLVSVASSIRTVSPGQVLGILLAYAFSILVLGIRWHVLTGLAGGAPRLTSSAEVFLTSVIVNYAAPIGLAVPTRAALTVRDLGLTPVQSGMVVGWELLLDILALLAIAAAWLILGGSELLQSASIDGRAYVIAGAAIVVALVGAFAISRIGAIRARLTTYLGPMLSRPARHPARSALAIALTGLFWAVQVGVMAALLAVFGVDPTPSLVTGLMGAPMLIGMLSPVPGGAGVREALMGASARLVGVPGAPVILAAVAYRLALFIVTPLVWGGLRLARAWGQAR